MLATFRTQAIAGTQAAAGSANNAEDAATAGTTKKVCAKRLREARTSTVGSTSTTKTKAKAGSDYGRCTSNIRDTIFSRDIFQQ
jgi:hypothetical protein